MFCNRHVVVSMYVLVTIVVHAVWFMEGCV